MKVWTQYAPHLKHIFLQGFEKGSFYISNPTHCENREVGGISPPWLKSFKNGGEFTPGGDITPLSFLSNLRRGGYHHLFRKLCKMGGISHLGGISPPCPYMASVNGCGAPLGGWKRWFPIVYITQRPHYYYYTPDTFTTPFVHYKV